MSRHGTKMTANILMNNYLTIETTTLRYDTCLLYTSDAADDLLCVDLGGRRIIKKKKKKQQKKTQKKKKTKHNNY